MKLIHTKLDGVLIIEPDVFGDARGFFMESWNAKRYAEVGLDANFVQDNLSYSARGVLRGLHYQLPHAQGKLVSVLKGEVFDVAVDIRRGSPTFGQWQGVTLNTDNKRQFYVPPGFAHGFCVLSEDALFSYKCTDYYCAECDAGVAWDDADIGIDWPLDNPQLSQKDAGLPKLADIDGALLPVYES